MGLRKKSFGEGKRAWGETQSGTSGGGANRSHSSFSGGPSESKFGPRKKPGFRGSKDDSQTQDKRGFKKKERPIPEGPSIDRRLYISNIPFDWTEVEIRDVLKLYGWVGEIALIREKGQLKRSMGYAFVDMMSKEDADKVFEKLNGANVAGRQWIVRRAQPRNGKAEMLSPSIWAKKNEEAQASATVEGSTSTEAPIRRRIFIGGKLEERS